MFHRKTPSLVLRVSMLMVTLAVSWAKKCYHCQNIPLPRVCQTMVECGQDHMCFVERFVRSGHTLFNSGCIKTQTCPQTGSSVLIGKRDMSKRHTHERHIECCHHEYCNDQAFGSIQIPMALRGPICFNCSSEPDPIRCYKVLTCPRNDVCLLERHSNIDSHLYTASCMNKHACESGAHLTGESPYVCCGKDYCNDRFMNQSRTIAPSSGKLTFPSTHTHAIIRSTTMTTLVATTKPQTSPTEITTSTTQTSPTEITTSTTQTSQTKTFTSTTQTSPTKTTTSITTISDTQLIEQACRKLLFQGYYYDSYTNLCIRVEKANVTRAHAERACAADGASLMVVDEASKQDLLIYWIFSHKLNDTDFWIGAKADTNKGHTFHWDDGSDLSFKTYNNWGNYLMGQPDDRKVKDENCVYMDYIDNYFWHDDECSVAKTGYICEIGPLSPNQEELECRKHVFGGYYYDHRTNFCVTVRTNQNVTYAEAAATCAKDHAHLANIDSAGKTNFLLTWIFSNQINQTDFWIGATDKYDNSSFYWSDGTALQYTHWGGPKFPPVVYGQPDEPRVTNQDCVYMDYVHNYYWYDDDCHNKRKGFICEIPDNGHLDISCRAQFSDGYFHDFYSNMCVKLHKTSGVTQAQATAVCQKESARLATIDNNKKTNFVLTWIFSHGINDTDFWIGAKDVHNTSTFYWPSGAKLNYTHWYTVKTPPPKTCVILDHVNNYKWLPAECNKPRTGFICEVNKHTIVTQH